MATIAYCHYATAQGLARDVYADIVHTYGIDEPHGIYQLMGHTPAFLAASWQRSRYLYGTDPTDTNISLSRLSLQEKHFVTLAVSATNNCEYCVRLHSARLEQLGMSPSELVELLMVVDVVNGCDKFAEGVRIGSDPTFQPSPASVAKADPLAMLDDFQAFIPRYSQATRQRIRHCLEDEGELGLRTKHMVALGVAATNGNDAYVDAYTTRLRQMGTSDKDLVELLLVVDLACGYNRYVQGLQISPGERAFVPTEERASLATCCT
jgi:AhpD family alkylhydroperoxidase